MDRVLSSLLQDFLQSNDLNVSKQDQDFEKFATYCVVNQFYSNDFDVEELVVGAGDDTGIDGIAIVVNGQLVHTTDAVDQLFQSNKYLDVTFIFIQAKTSTHFDSSEILNFAHGVHDIFNVSPKLKRNSDIIDAAEVISHIYKKARHFRETPRCHAYYVTTGNWTDDQNNIAAVSKAKEDIESTGNFSSVDVTPIGGSELSKIYRRVRQFHFSRVFLH